MLLPQFFCFDEAWKRGSFIIQPMAPTILIEGVPLCLIFYALKFYLPLRHVFHTFFIIFFRARSILDRPLSMAPTWSEESHPERAARNIWDCQFSIVWLRSVKFDSYVFTLCNETGFQVNKMHTNFSFWDKLLIIQGLNVL